MAKMFFRAVVFLLISSLFVSCSGLFSGGDDEEESKQSADGNTYIVVSAKAKSSRTIKPNIKAENLEAITLTGSLNGGDAKTLLEVDSYASLSDEKIAIEAGSWSFTLSGKIGESTFTGSTTETISIGTTTKLSFVLSAEEEYGGLSIVLNIEDTAQAASVKTILATLKSKDLSADVNTKTLSLSGGKATYSLNIASEAERLASGTYYVKFDMLTADGVSLNTYESYVRIVNGVTTSETIELTLNPMYKITYVYYENGKKITDDAELEKVGISSESEVVKLPVSYSRKHSELPLAEMEKEGCYFAGWYTDNTFTEKVSQIDTNSTADKTLYGCFINAVTVSASGSAEANILTGAKVNSVESAFAKINAVNQSELEWTIYIDGEVSENVSIIDELIAKSVTFAGVTGNATDSLNGGGQGCVLYVESTVPVYVRNLKITNGNGTQGGGICIGTDATVTLEDDALITGNVSQSGDCQGGGVYNKGTLVMTGGKITANACKSGDTVLARNGAGVYNGGTFKMGGDAVVTSDNDVYLPTGKYITIIDDLTATTAATITSQAGEGTVVVSGSDDALLANNYTKFAIKGEGSGTWGINASGVITYSDTADKIVTITFSNSSSSDISLSYGGNTLEENETIKDISSAEPFIVVMPEGVEASQITWSVDGTTISNEATAGAAVSGFTVSETGSELTVNKDVLSVGVYDVSVQVTAEGEVYSASLQIKVSN